MKATEASAVRIARHGGTEVLESATVAKRPPGPGEVRIDVAFVGVNYADVLARIGRYDLAPEPPFVPGIEVSGTVAEVGPGVAGLVAGDRVAAMTRFGGYAASVTTRADWCLQLPGEVGLEAGAALPVSWLSAYHALTTLACARPGEVLLVQGAGGGVGTAAVQVGKALGLKVAALSGDAGRRALVRDLGADAVGDYDALESTVAEASGGLGANVVLGVLGGAVLGRSIEALAPFGRVVMVGLLGGGVPLKPEALLFGSRGVLGFHLRAVQDRPHLVAEGGRWILERIADGRLRPVIDAVLPLDRAGEAHARLSARSVAGKLVLAVA
jgi:NADPH:quinone reductase-like Zn-dependent oxidoreductase